MTENENDFTAPETTEATASEATVSEQTAAEGTTESVAPVSEETTEITVIKETAEITAIEEVAEADLTINPQADDDTVDEAELAEIHIEAEVAVEEEQPIAEKKEETPPAIQFDTMSEQEILAYATQLAHAERVHSMDQLSELFQKAKEAMQRHHEAERQVAEAKYAAEAGNSEGFKFEASAVHQQFGNIYALFKEQKNKYYESLNREREENLKIKTGLIDHLKELVSQDISKLLKRETNDRLKEIRNQWKQAGPVPNPHLDLILYISNIFYI